MKGLALGLVLMTACGASGGTTDTAPEPSAGADSGGSNSASAGAAGQIASAGAAVDSASGFTSSGGASPVAGGAPSLASLGGAPAGGAPITAGGSPTAAGSAGALETAGAANQAGAVGTTQCSLDTMSTDGCTAWQPGTTPRGLYNAQNCACTATNSCAGSTVVLASPAVGSGRAVFKCASCDDCKAANQAAVNFADGK